MESIRSWTIVVEEDDEGPFIRLPAGLLADDVTEVIWTKHDENRHSFRPAQTKDPEQ